MAHPSLEGETFRVFPVHLETRSQANRQQALDLLLEHQKEGLSIWAGDFNATLEKNTVVDRILKETSSLTVKSGSPTFPSTNPHKTLDWIIVPNTWKPTDHQVIYDSYSDHALVVSEFSLKR